MTEDNKNIQEAEAKPEKMPIKSSLRKGWVPLVVLSFLLALAAWVAMTINEHVSFWTGVAGAIAALISSIKVGKGIWRDIAITCLIACAILLLVYGIFYTAILYAINSL